MTKKSIKFAHNPLFSGPSIKARSTFTTGPFRQIPISQLELDPEQPRRVYNEEALNSLADSINSYGILNPILVNQLESGNFKIVAGERRYRAAKIAGIDIVPVIIEQKPAAKADKLAVQLVENIQRQDLTSMEKALAIGQLRQAYNLSIREIAKKLGISKSAAQRSLDILELPDDLQAALIAGKPESKVLLLKEVSDVSKRKKLLNKIDDLSRKDLSSLVLSHSGTSDDGKNKKARKSKKELSTSDKRIIEQIQRSIGSKVKLSRKPGNSKAGSITVDFYTNSDLEELYKRLT